MPPGGFYLEIVLKYKAKQKQSKNGKFNFLSTIRLTQSILKHKFPSKYKLLGLIFGILQYVGGQLKPVDLINASCG